MGNIFRESPFKQAAFHHGGEVIPREVALLTVEMLRYFRGGYPHSLRAYVLDDCLYVLARSALAELGNALLNAYWKLPNFRPGLSSYAVELPNFRPGLSSYAVELPNFRPGLSSYAVKLPNFRPELSSYALQLPNFRPELSSCALQLPNFRPDLSNFGGELPNFCTSRRHKRGGQGVVAVRAVGVEFQ